MRKTKKVDNNSINLFEVNLEDGSKKVNENEELINRIIKNINSLAILNGINIGDLEIKSGVSVGYFSRLKKNSAQKIPIEMLIKVSEILGISIDALIKDDIKQKNDRETMLRSFIDKLYNDTENGKLYWEPYKLGTEESTLDEDDQYNDIITVQDLIRVYGCHSQVNMKFVPMSTSFVAELKEQNAYVVLNSGGYAKGESADEPFGSIEKPYSYEIYIRKNCETNYLCSTYELFGYTRVLIGQLYNLIKNKNSKIVLNDTTKSTIEDYLQNKKSESKHGGILFSQDIPFE